MTVSRVINNSPSVSPETRGRVQAIIEEMGYKLNVLAQNLSKGMGLEIGGVITGIEQVFSRYYFMEIIRNLEKVLDQEGHSLFIFNVVETRHREKVEKKLKVISDYYHSKVLKGVIVLGPPEHDERIKYLSENGVKGIAIGGKLTDPNFGYVDVDNYESAKKLILHILGCGHKHIAIINGPHYLTAAQEREAAFCETIKQHGLKVKKEYVTNGGFLKEGGREAARQLLRLKNPPTAIFAANDDMALGAYEAIYERGLKIPQDISIAGFDNIDKAAEVSPPLTTVAQPYSMIGELTGRHFIQQDFQVKTELPGLLIERSSFTSI
jgi:LacI family transcriptional regulator